MSPAHLQSWQSACTRRRRWLNRWKWNWTQELTGQYVHEWPHTSPTCDVFYLWKQKPILEQWKVCKQCLMDFFCHTQNNKLHGGANEAHLGNRAEKDWFQAWGREQRHDPVHYSKRCRASASTTELTCKTKQISKCNLQITCICLFLEEKREWFAFGCCRSSCQHVFHVSMCVFPHGRPAPRFAHTSVGRWSTCGSPWMGRMWTQCWRSWAFVSTGSSTSTYSSTVTAQWEACWPSATWLNTDGAPRTSGWAGGHRSRIHWSQGKTWLFQQRLHLCLLLHKRVRAIQVNALIAFSTYRSGCS